MDESCSLGLYSKFYPFKFIYGYINFIFIQKTCFLCFALLNVYWRQSAAFVIGVVMQSLRVTFGIFGASVLVILLVSGLSQCSTVCSNIAPLNKVVCTALAIHEPIPCSLGHYI